MADGMAEDIRHEGRMARSWRLMKDSYQLVRTNGGLVAYPIMSAVAVIVVVALCGGAIFGLTVPYQDDESLPGAVGVGIVVIVLIGIALLAYLTMKFAAGLIADAYARLRGEDGGFKYGMKVTRQRRKNIIGWTALNFTVGLVISSISQMGNGVGAIVSALGDLAWRVASWLALPVVVVEDLGPFASLKRSAQILRQTWGEQLVAAIGFGFIPMVAALPGLLLLILGLVLQSPIFVVGILWLVIAIPIAAVFVFTLTSVFRTALYIYATTGEAPEGFRAADVQGAFTTRR
jgi:Family of unknown function (DUF6159)